MKNYCRQPLTSVRHVFLCMQLHKVSLPNCVLVECTCRQPRANRQPRFASHAATRIASTACTLRIGRISFSTSHHTIGSAGELPASVLGTCPSVDARYSVRRCARQGPPLQGAGSARPSTGLGHGVANIRRSVAGRSQKSASSAKVDELLESSLERDDMTPDFWYSPTRFSKKLVLPCNEMSSIQSKGLEAL